MTQIFFHRIPRNLFGDFLLRRLLTDFRGGDLFGRCRYPLGLDKAIHQRFHKKSVEICEICGTKKLPRKKSASSAKSAWLKKRPKKNHEAKSPKKNLWDKRTTRRRTKTTISSWFSNEYRNHATVLALRLTLKDVPNLRMLPVFSPTWRANQHDW